MNPAVGPIEKLPAAADSLLDKGVLGTFVFLLAVALFFAIKGWLSEKDKRVEDQKAMNEALLKNNEKTGELTREAVRADDSLRVEVATLAKNLERVEDEISKLPGRRIA